MTINELQDEVIGEFSDFTDWMDKYQMLIDLGNDLEELDPKYKTEQNLIEAPSEPRVAAMRHGGWQTRVHCRFRRTHNEAELLPCSFVLSVAIHHRKSLMPTSISSIE